MDISSWFGGLGVESPYLVNLLVVLTRLTIGVLLGWLAYVVARKWLSKLVMKLVGRTANRWDDLLFDHKFFKRLGQLLAPIIIHLSIIKVIEWENMFIVARFLNMWIVFASVGVVSSLLDGVNRVYESYPVSRSKPIKAFMQVAVIFLYCAAVVITISIFTGESPTVLLAGLAAFAAVLMLIFQNSILGLVAGIQLSANDMVRIGDWIVMPSAGADGDVLEINLTTVKVQNFDKTITTVPTYKMVSESFTNWRGMEDSKGRRIKRSVYIDMNSIHYLGDKELEILKGSIFLKEYIENKMLELQQFNEGRINLLDERRLTNLGTFREYMEVWLERNPNINLDMTHMVRQLQPTPTGIPLEIYCFSVHQKWIDYENVQSDIFDHVFAVMELFGLKAFQYSGSATFSHSNSQ